MYGCKGMLFVSFENNAGERYSDEEGEIERARNIKRTTRGMMKVPPIQNMSCIIWAVVQANTNAKYHSRAFSSVSISLLVPWRNTNVQDTRPS